MFIVASTLISNLLIKSVNAHYLENKSSQGFTKLTIEANQSTQLTTPKKHKFLTIKFRKSEVS